MPGPRPPGVNRGTDRRADSRLAPQRAIPDRLNDGCDRQERAEHMAADPFYPTCDGWAAFSITDFHRADYRFDHRQVLVRGRPFPSPGSCSCGAATSRHAVHRPRLSPRRGPSACRASSESGGSPYYRPTDLSPVSRAATIASRSWRSFVTSSALRHTRYRRILAPDLLDRRRVLRAPAVIVACWYTGARGSRDSGDFPAISAVYGTAEPLGRPFADQQHASLRSESKAAAHK
jgi:hypothetical protein